MGMRLPSAYPLAKVPRLFLIKMLISDLNSAAVAAVEIQASANRALTCKCSLCSCVTVTSRSACEHTLESSGRNRCKLSTLINNAGNTVREGTAVDTVYYNRSDCHQSCVALAACLSLDQCCKHCHIIAVCGNYRCTACCGGCCCAACRTGL